MAGYGFGSVSAFSYPAIHQAIIESAYPPQVFRHLLEQDIDPTSKDKRYPVEDGDTSFTVNRVGEGAEAVMEVVQLTDQLVSTYKIGEGFPITFEDIQFARLPIVAYRPRKLGLKMGNTVDLDCLAVIGAGVPAGNVVAASGTTEGNTGETYTVAGSIGRNDVLAAIRRVQEAQIEPSDIVLNPIGWEMLRKKSVYSSINQMGMPGYATGKLPMIEGMRVHVTTNCPAGEAYVIATGNTSFSKQYIPMGFFLENYAIRTTSRHNSAKDQNEVYAYHQYAPVITRGRNIAEITYGGNPYT